jgi:hypothetical protein
MNVLGTWAETVVKKFPKLLAGQSFSTRIFILLIGKSRFGRSELWSKKSL